MIALTKSAESWAQHPRSNNHVLSLTELHLVLLMTLCTASTDASPVKTSEHTSRFSGLGLESSTVLLQAETYSSKNTGDVFTKMMDFAGQTFTAGDPINMIFGSERTRSNATLNNKMFPVVYSDVDGNLTNKDLSAVYTTTKTDSYLSTVSTVTSFKLPSDITHIISSETTDASVAINNPLENTSFTSSVTPLIQQEQPLVSVSVRIEISRYYALVVNPIIGIVGLVTNAISGIVIFRSGLQKPSNIFLLALAVSDWICMIRNVNVAWLLTYLRQKMPPRFIGWEMSFSDAFACYIIDKAIVRLSNLAAGMSTAVTVLITLERLLATFMPLRFSSILTPFRAWIVLASTTTFLLPPYMFKIFLDEFRYVYYPSFNTSMGTFGNAAFYNSSLTAITIFNSYFIIHFEFTLPLAIVLIGSLVLSVKILILRKKRQALIQGSTRQSPRTTTTLLMVCLLFSFTRISYLFAYLTIFDDTRTLTRSVSHIFVDVRWSLVQVNSACNIVVYVLFNPKFKRILKNLFVSKSKANRCIHI